MLLLSGLQKEDLDANTLAKLRRYNVNIDDMNNEHHQECISNPYTTKRINSNIQVTSEVAITKLPTEALRTPVTEKRAEQNSNSLGINPKLNVRFAQNSEDSTDHRDETQINITNVINDTPYHTQTPYQIPPLIYREGNVSNVEEAKDLQITFVKNQPDVESVLDFWSKLTHHTRTVATKMPSLSPTSAPNENSERNFTASLHIETKNANLHAKEMELISKLLADYIETVTKSEHTEYTTKSKVETSKKEVQEPNIARDSKNIIPSLKKQMNELSNFTKDDLRSNMLFETILKAVEGYPLKIMYNSSHHYKKSQETPVSQIPRVETKSIDAKQSNESNSSRLLSRLLRVQEDFENFASTISYSQATTKKAAEMRINKHYQDPVIKDRYKQNNVLPYLSDIKNSSQISEKKRNVENNPVTMKQWDPVRVFPTKKPNHVLPTGDYAKKSDEDYRSRPSQNIKEKSPRIKSKRRYAKSDDEREIGQKTEQPQYLNIVNNQVQSAEIEKHKRKQKRHHYRDVQPKTFKSFLPSIKQKKQSEHSTHTHSPIKKRFEITSNEKDCSESADDSVIERRQLGNAYKKGRGNYRYMNNEPSMNNEIKKGGPSSRQHVIENTKVSQNRQHRINSPIIKKWQNNADSMVQVKRRETPDVTNREQQPAVGFQPVERLEPVIGMQPVVALQPAADLQPLIGLHLQRTLQPAPGSLRAVDAQLDTSSQPAAGSHPIVKVRAIGEAQPLSPKVIKEIAEKVKEIVLKDIEEGVTIRNVGASTTVGTTTTEVSVQSISSTTLSTTTTTPTPRTTTEKSTTMQKNTEANPVMQQLMEIFKELKGIKEPTTTTTTSTTQAPQPTTVSNATPILQKIPTLPVTQKYPQIFNPYVVKGPPNVNEQMVNSAPYMQGLPYIAHLYSRPITIQTNDDQIAPLAIQISKPLKAMNQHVVITTQDPNEKIKQELQRESKKRIEENFRMPHSELAKVQFADNMNRHDDRVAYKNKFIKDRDKPWYYHEHNDDVRHDDSHPMDSRFKGSLSHLQDLNRASSMSHTENLPYNGRITEHEYNQPHSQQSDMGNLDVMQHNSRGQSYSDYERHKPMKFHENLERFEDWPRNNWKEIKSLSAENSCEEIPARHQVPIVKEKERTRYDDTHFTNFLKSQQKVTDMLEKMLANNMKDSGDQPLSMEDFIQSQAKVIDFQTCIPLDAMI
ncbi:hypothetical protein SFRURICE_012080 [Spodoptera frugiperda]|nr:hypothetical protein SFRURICE_012080 [Spodoptera frugiperda]